MEHENDQEGMSTGKKIAAGAAVGLAVPAAVGVAKKLMGDDGDDGQDARQQAGRARTRTSARSRRTGTTRGKTRSSSSSTRTRSSSSSRSRSAAKSRTSSGGRTKEQLYNQAKRLKIEGRSSMTKAQLERAISRKR
jgi:hypothetical protein